MHFSKFKISGFNEKISNFSSSKFHSKYFGPLWLNYYIGFLIFFYHF